MDDHLDNGEEEIHEPDPNTVSMFGEEPAPAPSDQSQTEYQVLARKYRPQTFDDLIGQEALVRTLSNAFDSGRIAHAFVMTGVRGVGKTTTARIIARGLNCSAQDRPTIKPCGKCDNCKSIAESRHVDVLEMDAASRTGINDIRELIDGVQYLPVQARYKVYIIDEVHMLSNQAFNGLLKTLEEPPEHVKFIFATTEIRKIPITVLSRCQRFDLRRISADLLINHFNSIAEKEGAFLEDGALRLIARAAEGSARDGLSLLDQAIAQAANGSGERPHVTEEAARAMLGLADRARVLDLFDLLMKGDPAGALSELKTQYDQGADPVVIVSDLLEVSHWLTRIKLTPDQAGDDATTSEADRAQGREIADRLNISVLSRTWQMLLKGLGEVRGAPNAISAAEMVLIRIMHAADLPNPEDLIKMIQEGKIPSGKSVTPNKVTAGENRAPSQSDNRPMAVGAPMPSRLPETVTSPIASAQPVADDMPATFESLVATLEEKREALLLDDISRFVHLVKYEPGRIEFRPAKGARRDLAGRLAEQLKLIFSQRWVISISSEEGSPTLAEARAIARDALESAMLKNPLVRSALDTFPEAKIVDVREQKIDTTTTQDT